MQPRYETYNEIKKTYNISSETVRNWAKRGAIKHKCIQNDVRKTWLYDINSIGDYLQQNTERVALEEEKRGKYPCRFIYIRVSSDKQHADLERQRELLLKAFPDTRVISDIGSGLNFHKAGITKLVRKICRDKVTQVVVTYRDRIARFGYDLFELLCKEHGCSILVYGEGIDSEYPPSEEHDLQEDLLSVVNVFVASHNGRRSAALRKERKRLESERDSQGETLSYAESKEEVRSNVLC